MRAPRRNPLEHNHQAHSVRGVAREEQRFLAVYVAPRGVTTYERPVQPDAEREREAAI